MQKRRHIFEAISFLRLVVSLISTDILDQRQWLEGSVLNAYKTLKSKILLLFFKQKKKSSPGNLIGKLQLNGISMRYRGSKQHDSEYSST